MGSEAAYEYDLYVPGCPSRQVLDLIGDRWTVLIVLTLFGETLRFTELRKRLAGISPKVLTNALRRLEHDGIVTRVVYAEVPPRVEYSLTDLGRTLDQPLRAIRDWAVEHMPDIERARSTASSAAQ